MAPTDEDSTADDGYAERWGDPEERWRPEKRWGNPEERWGDPERRRDPNRDADEEDDTPDFSDVDSELVTAFAVSVILTNAALLALSLGLMLAYFRGRYQLGGALVVGGALLLFRVYRYYRQFRRDRERGESEASGASDAGEPADDAGSPRETGEKGETGDAPRND